MATYPYIPVQGAVRALFAQLKNSFPNTVDAAYLQKSGLAPGNEGSALGVLRFIGVTDDENKKVDPAWKLFNKSDAEFEKGLLKILTEKYADLIQIYPEAWKTEKSKLVHYFREADDTGKTTGGRQASTFLTLAELAGCEVSQSSASRKTSAKPSPKTKAKPKQPGTKTPPAMPPKVEPLTSPVQFAIRIEMNLPVTDDQKVYDALFKSMRENLIDLED